MKEHMYMRSYRIELRTDLGARHGFLRLFNDSGTLEGKLELLGHIEPVYGEVNAGGSCRLWGNLVTLGRVMAYTASGRLDTHGLCLLLQTGHRVFQLNGIAEAEGDEVQTNA